MKHLFTLLILFFACAKLLAQTDSVLQVKHIDTLYRDIRDMAVDNLGNLYLVSGTNQIKKVSANGDSIGVYNNVRRYGKIYSLDVSNPLKVVVYYKDFATIVVLDRFLNVRNTIDLRKLNILQASAVATSYDNNFWVYDDLDNKLKKINDNGIVIMESADYRQAFDVVPVPAAIFDRNGMLYLSDFKQGIFLLDYYGAKKNFWPFPSTILVEVVDKNVLIIKNNNGTYLVKPLLLQQFAINGLPLNNPCKKLAFYNNRLYCLNESGTIAVYQL